MKDPKSAPAGSDKEPAAPNPEVELVPPPADYQFSSRKARRQAELTGMIPIIVPKNSGPAAFDAQEQADPAVAGEAQASTDEVADKAVAGTGVVDDGTGAVVSDGTVLDGTAPGDVPGSTTPDGPAVPDSPAVLDDDTVLDDETQAGVAETLAPEDAKAAMVVSAPGPVSALQVTGIPLIPVPQGPIAAMPAAATTVKAPRTPKAGRDLPAAITVGIALLVLVIGSLLFYPVAFVGVATLFVCAGVWEVNRAVAGKGVKAPMVPVMIGAMSMPAAAYFAGSEGLLFALVASAGATVLWRSLDAEPGAVKSMMAGVFTLMWIPFLLSFVFLMLRDGSGPTFGLTLDLTELNTGVVQVIIMLLLVVANDTFGYLVGVLFGKHPMAPKISPKKSWEGFAGSLGGATLVAIPATVFLLDQHWWVGLALAVGMVFAGTGGDFAESMVKRELGVKDMSNLLPGHGGVMDRLDSILFAAPVAYAIFTVLGRF